MTAEILGKLHRGLAKPPRYVVERLLREARGTAERYLAPLRAGRTTGEHLAWLAGHANVDEWWNALAVRPYVVDKHIRREDLDRLCPGDAEIILADAERALLREVDLLGSGAVDLGTPIDWHRDYKSGHRWEPRYCRDIEYANFGQPSDVKFPWEVSRMQWLIPVGQAYALTGDERYAIAVREIVDEWIAENAYAMGVNWSCTMDVALRAMTWTYFFHALHGSRAWSDPIFRARFLRALWLHGDFTARHLEKSDINGNHYTADAAGLVFVGLFFGGRGAAQRWQQVGWNILNDELPKQVFPDGVDFEASVAYHRLVQELILLPALYRQKLGLDVTAPYRERLLAMARYTEAYSRVDGSVPLWGDADDARALPLRLKPINDHRYLLAIAGLTFSDQFLLDAFSGPRSEIVWLLGPEAASQLPDRQEPALRQRSAAFPDGGFFVLRNNKDHVFIDCGPLGLAGRGGHGHNDLLSFEAVLDGVHLVSDCGSHLYTASVSERNLFRSTACHNTPKIDGEEINRFVRPDYLWTLHNDARHLVEELSFSADIDLLRIGHTGYERLPSPVKVRRAFELDRRRHTLVISDELLGTGEHTVEIPLHFAIGVDVELWARAAMVTAGDRRFELTWSPADAWVVEVRDTRVSPTYGVAIPARGIVWRRSGCLRSLRVELRPIFIADTHND